MRQITRLHQDWLFVSKRVELDAPSSIFETVTIPHANKYFDQRYVDKTEYEFVSTYRKHLSLAEPLQGKQVFLDFDGVMLQSIVYVNGEFVGEHHGGYTPFSFEITRFLADGDNILTLYVDATELPSIPPFGGFVDYLAFGGVYRDVFLRIVDECHIQSAFVQPQNVLNAPSVICDVELNYVSDNCTLETIIADAESNVVAQSKHSVAAEHASLAIDLEQDVALWTLNDPCLYVATFNLYDGETLKDSLGVRFGFRAANFSEDGKFYLNGEPLTLFGLNRHQTFPYIGAAAPKRLQEMDADILKYELGCNIVRTSHYPQSRYFHDRCDEIGLLVFEEIPGWQHIGDAEWQKLVLRDVEAMIKRDRNRPSVILWGVRINESPDNEALYTQTNALAHQLDPTRQTGGVRDFNTSQQLEDVYTLNDFPPGIQTPRAAPHMVTEFAGHMYPTKTWDQEERRVEHALHHAHKHELVAGHPDISGATGWCAFDYHTHKQFGSGDRICHHGVMDMFRMPKLAAYFYRSQKSPQDEVVVHAATSWTMGDRAVGGNNPLVVFSNCEAINVLIGDELQGTFKPDRETYPHLAYPPFVIRWPEPYNPWGTEFADLTVQGIIGDKVVKEHVISSDHVPHKLHMTANTDCLVADGIDMAHIAVSIVDQYGNTLPYQMRVVQFEVEGDAELIGENPSVLLGGQVAVFVRSCRTVGNVIVRATVNSLPSAQVNLQIDKDSCNTV